MDTNAPQTVLITGGGGFLGNLLAEYLLRDKRIQVESIVLSDVVEPRDVYGFEGDKRVIKVKSDLTKASDIDALFSERRYTAIAAFHGLMSGGSEANFELGMAVNLDSTRMLLEKIRSLHDTSAKPPVLLFTSSGAVYGGDLPDNTVTDATVPAPQGSYGIQKLICESLCYEYSRRGWIDARIVRLPTVMVRPGAPNTALSSYASGIVREPLKGENAVCPVSLDFAIFISSPATIVGNFVHLLIIDGSRYPHYTRTCALPGISVTTQEILDALEKVGGKEAVKLVDVKPDEGVLKIVRTWPGKWVTDRAMELGCKRDEGVLGAVQQYKEMLDSGRG